MCTAISFKTAGHYFGRNLDLEYRYSEQVVITPRSFPLAFRRMPVLKRHYAFIGMATVVKDYPLYYEATNECGLSVAGLNFPGYAYYPPEDAGKDNIAPFELIPWILAQCASAKESWTLLSRLNPAAIPFSGELPLSPLHWLISDAQESIVAEPVKDSLILSGNPVGVLTNSPPIDYHITRLREYMALRAEDPDNAFDPSLPLRPFSRGMGAIGLPGDLSSPSRFVRAAFLKAHSRCADDEIASVTQFFHLLGAVRHLRGSVMVDGKPEITLYSSCCSTEKGIYYYTTYGNSRITAVDMRREDLDSDQLIAHPLIEDQTILYQNR